MKTNKKIVSVDVGGTYCDAVIHDGEKKCTVKLLSIGVLRCKAVRLINSNTIEIEQNWKLPFPHVLTGAIVDWANQNAIIKSFDDQNNALKFSSPLNIHSGEILDISIGHEAPVFAAHLLTGIPLDKDLKEVELRVGTTKATNALLEHKGISCVWITNTGFKDLLYIKTQQRPNIFQLEIPEPVLLHGQVIETKARMDATGKILTELTLSHINNISTKLPKDKTIPIAISLLHSYKFPIHEITLKKELHKKGYVNISISSHLQPTIHFLPRAETTVCNAYLSPLMNNFIQSLLKKIHKKDLYFISSSGQLINQQEYNPKDSLFSGPAGGIKASEYFSTIYDIRQLITFDMGGTSTDTARIDSKATLRYFSKIGEHQIASPSFEIETVAAGGGSIVDFRNGAFTVGPESAGAYPGPACYNQQGPFTITDLNLLLDRLVLKEFNIPISKEAAEIKFRELVFKAGLKNIPSTKAKSILQGIEKIANEKMADAIKKISIAKGYNTSNYTLLVFGGAGGLHACGIAEILRLNRILIPFDSGVFSALGISKSSQDKLYIKQLNQLYSSALLKNEFKKLYGQIRADMRNLHHAIKKVYMRYLGQNETIEVNYSNNLKSKFENIFKQQFGVQFDKPIEIEKITLTLPVKSNKKKKIKIIYEANAVHTPHSVLYWQNLKRGNKITGPSIVYHNQATVFIAAGWQAIVQTNKDLMVTKKQKTSSHQKWDKKIELELFSNRFKSIAEQMGVQLQRSAFSVNVKERLDFSCALLNNKGFLIANAPHIPVHLGSLGICARTMIKDYPLDEGDIILTNHPLYGGSHLPDLTLLKGVFKNHKLIGYVINRAHHAEIGGKTPGSMPSDATTLAEEGIVFPPTYIYKKGVSKMEEIKQKLANNLYPSRDPQTNILDIMAAIQALRTGEKELQSLCDEYSSEYLNKEMKNILKQSDNLISEFIANNKNQIYRASEYMDDGSTINLAIRIRDKQMHFDFSGSSAVHPGNLNSNLAIVYSTIVYVLRLLIGKNVPLNDGLMKKVKITSPRSFITPRFELNPEKCPAVVGGNTEVSQRITDTILKAFRLSACSQGTMNNFLFGNNKYSYYETIGGGTGATGNKKGRSAVHQHMTNTKITDHEELEFRYPVILEKFEIRKNSGGKGFNNGGDGITRQIKFLEPMTATILAQHRTTAPYGLNNGESGSCGNQYLITSNKKIKLEANTNIAVKEGERIVIETPGGGGWGKKKI